MFTLGEIKFVTLPETVAVIPVPETIAVIPEAIPVPEVPETILKVPEAVPLSETDPVISVVVPAVPLPETDPAVPLPETDPDNIKEMSIQALNDLKNSRLRFNKTKTVTLYYVEYRKAKDPWYKANEKLISLIRNDIKVENLDAKGKELHEAYNNAANNSWRHSMELSDFMNPTGSNIKTIKSYQQFRSQINWCLDALLTAVEVEENRTIEFYEYVIFGNVAQQPVETQQPSLIKMHMKTHQFKILKELEKSRLNMTGIPHGPEWSKAFGKQYLKWRKYNQEFMQLITGDIYPNNLDECAKQYYSEYTIGRGNSTRISGLLFDLSGTSRNSEVAASKQSEAAHYMTLLELAVKTDEANILRFYEYVLSLMYPFELLQTDDVIDW